MSAIDEVACRAISDRGEQPSGNRELSTAEAPVRVSHLNRSYGPHKAVNDVSFTLTTGVTALLGTNGAGKSSLMTCVAGIAGWDDGEVWTAGINLAKRPIEGRRRVGFMPERIAFPIDMRVVEFLRFVATVKGVPRPARAEQVEAALSRTGLTNVRDRIVVNLSKGYRQRVGLAQAILGDPPVIVLDEPTAGLDPLSVLSIRDLLQEYAYDRAVLVSTHQLPDARLMCDRILIMSGGRLVYDGAPGGMAGPEDAQLRCRLRISGRAGGKHPPELPLGVELVHAQAVDDEWLLVVDTKSRDVLGGLVRQLSEDWLVLGVEPTMDALEDAFRRAVVGDGLVGGRPAA
jgi:ABC-2 type transport system ATP-binding protein